MYRPSINTPGSARLEPRPNETLALSDEGTFTTPIVSTFDAYDHDGHHLATIIEYAHVPATWSDDTVRPEHRRTHPDHVGTPIPRQCTWVRLIPGRMPSLARSLEETIALLAIDIHNSNAARQLARKPMVTPS